MSSRVRTFGAVVALAVLALTGCVNPPAPTPSPSASTATSTASATPSAPTSTPSPDAADPVGTPRIVIGGESVSVADAEGSVANVSAYGGPANQIVDSLTELLGEPSTTVHQNEKCVNDSVDKVWGGMRLSFLGMEASTSSGFTVMVRAGVPGALVETTNGARVGESWPSYYAGVSDHPQASGEYDGKTWTDLIDESYAAWGPESGTLVNTDDGTVITYITAPSGLGHDC